MFLGGNWIIYTILQRILFPCSCVCSEGRLDEGKSLEASPRFWKHSRGGISSKMRGLQGTRTEYVENVFILSYNMSRPNVQYALT